MTGSSTRKVFLLVCAILGTVYAVPLGQQKADTCGYQSCPVGDPGFLNVHLICHTHDDVGWLKTVDQYYYGDRNDIQRAGVQYILDSVVRELIHDVNKKFIYVETSFFWRWWNEQSDTVQQQVKGLVSNGQLEFIGGGWCMNDEAAAHYRDIIDQMSWGYRFLNDTFGPCANPRIAWQIDPFGHARENAALSAQMGVDGLFFGRLDYEDKTKREVTNTMEFVWDASSNLGVEADLFTGVLPNMYQPPNGFCFDDQCNDEPIQDDPILKDYNVDRRVDQFLREVQNQAAHYSTNHLIMTMGSDFHYHNANSWYKNLDKLIKYVNARQNQGGKVNIFYSTPSCYLQALHNANKTWSVKTDDFFPYGSDGRSYWTGYFTSRSALKGYVRYGSNFLQTCKQLDVFAQLDPSEQAHIAVLKRAQGDLQHHDGVSGTSKQHVANDYAESQSTGIASCEKVINDAYQVITPLATGNTFPRHDFCHYLNASVCAYTESGRSFALTVYNPLAKARQTHVRVPIKTAIPYSVEGPDGAVVNSEIISLPASVVSTPEHTGTATEELVFAVSLPASGFSTYFVNGAPSSLRRRSRMKLKGQAIRQLRQAPKADAVIQNEFLEVTIDGASGLLKTIRDKTNQATYNVQQSFRYYNGTMHSGAYVFQPQGPETSTVSPSATFQVILGGEVQEVHQVFNQFVSQVIRLYKNERNVEFEYLVGPIPVADGVGKEVITYLETDLQTNGYFYTDSNGRESIERRRNFRPTWDLTVTEPVAGNYYPINTFISIKDEVKDQQLTVIVDRAVGGSSIADGSVEIMLHRRLLHDDGYGVGEALNEPGVDNNGLVVRGKYKVLVSSPANAAQLYRDEGIAINAQPVIAVADLGLAAITPAEWRAKFKTTFTGVNATLPSNVHLLTVEQWHGNSVLVRVENYLEKTDSPNSGTVNVDLGTLFGTFKVISAEETTLGADRWKKDLNRFSWNTQSNEVVNQPRSSFADNRIKKSLRDEGLVITLDPMQIRSFVVQLAAPN